MTGRPPQTISTHDLQRSHHIFGNFENPWTTTSQTSYFPKDMDNKKFSKDLTKTNFVFGEDRPDFKSISQSVYVPHELVKSDGTKQRSNDLRSHHFTLGNDNGDMLTINRQDYANSNDDKNSKAKYSKLDPQFLRASHFQLGDKSQMPPDQWATTYGTTMIPNTINDKNKKINNSFKSSLVINPDGNQFSFQTESRVNYNYKTNNITREEINNIKTLIGHIRGHNFDLGKDKNDFATTSGATYKFDQANANNSRGFLNPKLKDDLRATHFQLGFDSDKNQTSHQSSYVPLNVDKQIVNDPNLKRNNFNLNQTNRNVFEGKSVYMVDYTKKDTVE